MRNGDADSDSRADAGRREHRFSDTHGGGRYADAESRGLTDTDTDAHADAEADAVGHALRFADTVADADRSRTDHDTGGRHSGADAVGAVS